MLPDEYKGELVDASLYMMRVLSNAYGSDTAMDMWGKLSDVIDPDLKGLVFSAMLTGSVDGKITVIKLRDNAEIIPLIKAIRAHDKRNLGLKEAKDMVYMLRDNGKPIKLDISAESSTRARRELREAGGVIQP